MSVNSNNIPGSQYQNFNNPINLNNSSGEDEADLEYPKNNGVNGVDIHANLNGQRNSNLNINLKKKVQGNNNQDPSIKTYHMVTWNNKTYRLTQLYNDGTTVRQIGFTQTDWTEIAQKQIAVWNAAITANPQFTFSHSSLNVDSGTFKYRETAEQPVQTVDCNNPASHSLYAVPMMPAINKLKDLFAPNNPNKVKPRHMEPIRGNPPQPTFAAKKKPAKDPLLNPPQNLLNNPALPAPEEVHWWQFGKKIKNFFTNTFNPQPPVI